MSHFFTLSLSLFFLMDPLGNIPLYISILKNLDPKKQKRIITRELIIALFVILFFAYLGDQILSAFHIDQSTVSIAGGTILFIIALKMIFPKAKEETPQDINSEPFIVPLAIPLVAGPTILAAVMIYARQDIPPLFLGASILAAWIGSFIILIFSDKIQKALKPRGVQACERLMGLILTLIAIQMFMEGIANFIH